MLPLSNFMYILDRFGRKIDMREVAFVNRLFELKQKSGSKPWPVIEEIIKYWSAKNPTNWRSFLYQLDEVKQTRLDQKFGLSKGGTMRYTLDMPEAVQYMIRMMYNADELPMNSQFFLAFARKFPAFKVAEKI